MWEKQPPTPLPVLTGPLVGSRDLDVMDRAPALQELTFRWGEDMGGLLPSSGTSAAASPAV